MKKINLPGLLSLLFILFSCQQNEDLSTELNQEQDFNQIKTKSCNGVLVFDDWGQVYALMDSINLLPDEERINWENENCFQSMKSVFNNYSDEQEVLLNQLTAQQKSGVEITKDYVASRHNQILQRYKNAIIVLELEDHAKYFDMNLHHFYLAPVVNENGMVSVNGAIFRFTNNDIRVIENGDWSLVSQIMQKSIPSQITNISILGLDEAFEGVAKGGRDIDPPGDDDCGTSLHSYVTNNAWSEYACDNDGLFRTLSYYKFDQKKYWYEDFECEYHEWYDTKFYFKIRSLKRCWGLYFNYNAFIQVHHKCTGDNGLSDDRYYVPIDVSIHTFERTIHQMTSANEVAVSYVDYFLVSVYDIITDKENTMMFYGTPPELGYHGDPGFF